MERSWGWWGARSCIMPPQPPHSPVSDGTSPAGIALYRIWAQPPHIADLPFSQLSLAVSSMHCSPFWTPLPLPLKKHALRKLWPAFSASFCFSFSLFLGSHSSPCWHSTPIFSCRAFTRFLIYPSIYNSLYKISFIWPSIQISFIWAFIFPPPNDFSISSKFDQRRLLHRWRWEERLDTKFQIEHFNEILFSFEPVSVGWLSGRLVLDVWLLVTCPKPLMNRFAQILSQRSEVVQALSSFLQSLACSPSRLYRDHKLGTVAA